ncbi:MAG: transporter substrate-binding domain-containing protein [Acidocella sp.]|nr:transporter substrate-binding domain-containing protein [Acidocella sp.]
MITRRYFSQILAASFGTAAALTAATPAFAGALADIMKSGTIKIAVPQDFPPFGSVGADMQPQGYDIDMARLIASKMGLTLDLVPVTSENRIPFLQTHKVDIVISSLGKTPDRAKVIDFSDEYAPYVSGIFGPPSVLVSTPADLAGKTIGVTRGALEDLEVTKIAPPSAIINRYGDNQSTIAAFLSGQVQLIGTASAVASAIIARHPPVLPGLKITLKNSPCYIGLNKNEPDLMAKLNSIIATAKKDGSLNAISLKWLQTPLPAGF